MKKTNSIGELCRTKHLEFIKFIRNRVPFKISRIERTSGVRSDKRSGVHYVVRSKEEVFVSKVMISPEYLAYTYSLEGCPRKLLHYVMFCELDIATGRFKFDQHVKDHFKDFCALFGDTYQDAVIDQAIQTLVERNVVVNQRRGTYMINPLIAGGKRVDNKSGLINDYSFRLIKRKRDAETDYFPIYNRTGKKSPKRKKPGSTADKVALI